MEKTTMTESTSNSSDILFFNDIPNTPNFKLLYNLIPNPYQKSLYFVLLFITVSPLYNSRQYHKRIYKELCCFGRFFIGIITQSC